MVDELLSNHSRIESSKAGLDVSSAQSVQQIMCHKLQMCEKPVEFLSTVYKQDKCFAQHDLYVEPESVCFGARYELHSGTDKLVYDLFIYLFVHSITYIVGKTPR
jgi:hypothetical protein